MTRFIVRTTPLTWGSQASVINMMRIGSPRGRLTVGGNVAGLVSYVKRWNYSPKARVPFYVTI